MLVAVSSSKPSYSDSATPPDTCGNDDERLAPLASSVPSFTSEDCDKNDTVLRRRQVTAVFVLLLI